MENVVRATVYIDRDLKMEVDINCVSQKKKKKFNTFVIEAIREKLEREVRHEGKN